MLNDAWVKLTGLTRTGPLPVHPWDEAGAAYAPPDQYPNAVDAARRAVLGPAPDVALAVWRARQLLAVAYATSLGPLLDAADRRRTFDPARWQGSALGPLGVTVTVENGFDQIALPSVYGPLPSAESMGRVELDFTVEVLTATAIRVTRVRPPGFAETFTVGEDVDETPLGLTDGSWLLLSTGLSLLLTSSTPGDDFLVIVGDTGLTLRLPGGVVAGSRYLISLRARPALGVPGLVAAVDNLGEPIALALFGLKPGEPDASLRAAWASADVRLRAAALACALVLRSEG